MSNLIPFESNSQLPAYLKTDEPVVNEFGFTSSAGFKSISLKGKVFTISSNGEKTLVTKPGGDGEPAPSIEVVILNSGPKGGVYAKTFYATGFVEGSNAKPTCYSNDGVAPAADAQESQSKKCALCPQNAAGSGATAQNPKAKACRSSKMLAVAPAGQLNDPMMLRVPGASLIKLGEYGDALSKRGVKARNVVTKIGFDYTVAHPALTFKAVGFVTPEMNAEIGNQAESVLVKAIIGEKSLAELAAATMSEDLEAEVPATVETPEPVAEKPKAAKPAAKAAPAVKDDLPDTPPPNKVKVEEEAPKAAVKKEPVAVETDGPMDAALDALDFDD